MDAPDDSSSEPQTVLLVEDAVLVRLALAEYLRDCGYKVCEASNSAEAMAILLANERVNVVFSDVRMPGAMDGFGLADWVRQNRPTIKVILTSGYRPLSGKANELCHDVVFLAKPYGPDVVFRHILEQLSAREHGPSPSL